MTFINKLIYLKNICCPCLIEQQLQKSKQQKQIPLLQLKENNSKQKIGKQSYSRQKSNDISTSQMYCISENGQNNKMFKSLNIQKSNSLNIQVRKQINQIGDVFQQNKSDSSFHTVKSTLSRPISRRQFKLLKNSSIFRNSKGRNQEEFFSANQSDNLSFKPHIMKFIDQFQQNQSQSINTLIKKQYPKLQNAPSIHINQIMKLKIKGKDNFDSLVHKIQDYYTFYFDYEQETNNLSECQLYIGKNNSFVGSFNKTSTNKTFDSQKSFKYMSLCIIQHINVSPLKFIQWFNQQQIQSIFHNFSHISYVQINQISQQYPILIVEQFNQHLIGKSKFNLIKQIQSVKFENQEQESILEVDYQISDQKKYFQRLIRIGGLQNVKVQIYTESSQNIKDSQQKYFKNIWIQFQERLYKDKIIKSQFKSYLD